MSKTTNDNNETKPKKPRKKRVAKPSAEIIDFRPFAIHAMIDRIQKKLNVPTRKPVESFYKWYIEVLQEGGVVPEELLIADLEEGFHVCLDVQRAQQRQH